MTEIEQAEVRQHVNNLIAQHTDLRRKQNALLDIMENLADPSIFYADLQMLCNFSERLMDQIEAGWELLRDEPDRDQRGCSSLLH